ncbi:hypothetical protein PCANC_26929 [Puccinia coronata f. sp. avenae]|jgi:hypothetical protein|uniref:Uncharacterized protein n=1 Tax=Puccinia coronata f. sp. avenae TaxID=200324 RepID=A0A2N5UWW6_9BASI|nr:hypothetical protein PCANC_26929 [Puccinia coronata f. sp. avenae]PLW42258.1 hypothetical protein PCASD_07706 [Puccinia coronata f. sp. avenae]
MATSNKNLDAAIRANFSGSAAVKDTDARVQDVSFCPPLASLKDLLTKAYSVEPLDPEEIAGLELRDGFGGSVTGFTSRCLCVLKFCSISTTIRRPATLGL